MSSQKLLVVDDDFEKYDTPAALIGAIRRLGEESTSWNYDLCCQDDAMKSLECQRYSAVLVDNDFGRGVSTLAGFLGRGIPMGYVTAYDISGLRRQYANVPESRILDPAIFEDSRIALIQKRGKNVGRDISLLGLEESIYNFLKSIGKSR